MRSPGGPGFNPRSLFPSSADYQSPGQELGIRFLPASPWCLPISSPLSQTLLCETLTQTFRQLGWAGRAPSCARARRRGEARPSTPSASASSSSSPLLIGGSAGRHFLHCHATFHGAIRAVRPLPLSPAGCGSRESRPPYRSPSCSRAEPTSAIQSRAPRTGKGCRQGGDWRPCSRAPMLAATRLDAPLSPPRHSTSLAPLTNAPQIHSSTLQMRGLDLGALKFRGMIWWEMVSFNLLYLHRLKHNWRFKTVEQLTI